MKALNGNSQLFLCLQDISATADNVTPLGEKFGTSGVTTFTETIARKMQKVRFHLL